MTAVGRQKVDVVGIGNLLMRDDGLGVHAIRALDARQPMPGVRTHEVGTSTMALLDVLVEGDKVIVVDAICGDQPPGTVYRMTPAEDRRSETAQSPVLSSHESMLADVIAMARWLGSDVEVVVVGVQPGVIEPALGLSDAALSALPRLIELIEAEQHAPRKGENTA